MRHYRHSVLEMELVMACHHSTIGITAWQSARGAPAMLTTGDVYLEI